MGNTISTKTVLAVLFLTVIAGCSSTPRGNGTFIAPVEQVSLSSPFGQRGNRPHYGLDFRATKGTAVGASAAGVVTFRGRQRGFGRLIIVRHAGGYETYYAHLSRFGVREGKRVGQGDTVGYVGKSGNATGYHLHFEIRQRGTPIDPATVLTF